MSDLADTIRSSGGVRPQPTKAKTQANTIDGKQDLFTACCRPVAENSFDFACARLRNHRIATSEKRAGRRAFVAEAIEARATLPARAVARLARPPENFV
jgi:hypothetical protein